ncbi:calpain-1 catalytic subunit-like [Oreochromis niloticus]|uniref:calpain-1 catalytic subunit-like n=1 Tax=Oreochromis niloticus TaxID=8128 RepID=UPI000393C808|nr:calpain-1 catalytic subunit-like [Oreochromis niloticus]
MAKSETCLVNLRYQDGSEGSPTNPAKFKNQDFAQIKADCLQKGELFVDNEFPPNGRSLGDLPDLSSSQESEVKWLRPADLLRKQGKKDKPAFSKDGMSRFDFGQGDVGNCWFLSAISALTFQKGLMAQVVPMDQSFEDYAGIFHFRFWRFGKWIDVVIDDYLPTINKRLLSVSSKDGNEFWAPLLEKAYAKVCGSYADMHGGSSSEACKDFTGGVNQIYHLTEANAPSHDELWLTLSRATECKSLICCGTLHKKDFLANIGLVDGHAYSITEITEVELNGSKVRLVRIMNPWGKREWSGKWSDKSDLWNKVRPDVRKKCFDRDDGEFWMELEDFFRYFSAVFICCETPNFLDGDFKCQWKCMIYDGRVEEGAANHSTFATNPQYRIQVSVIDKLEPEDKNILLSLMEKPQQDSRNEIKLNSIGLTIYKVRPGTPQGRLGSDFFNRTSPVKAPTIYTGFREVVELLSLEPGEYVIIPFTNKPNVTADFVLTVYTKADVKIRSYDGGDDNEDNDHLSEIRDKDKERVTDDDPNHALFKLYANQNDELIPRQLQKLLNDRFPHGSGHRGFSLDTCRSMIALVDLDQRMTMTFAEFSILWKKIQEYKNLFHRCDVNENGSLSSPELQKAMEAAGMDVNDGIVGLMMFRYSGFSSTSLEEFITLMLRLDKMSDIFKGKSSDGVIHLNWDEWSVISMYN